MDKEKEAYSKLLQSKEHCAELRQAQVDALSNQIAFKSSFKSQDSRKSGSDLFKYMAKCGSFSYSSNLAVHRYFNQSIAYAPVGSLDLAFAYGNRSALLFHMQKYEDCLKDIDRALKIENLSNVFELKVKCRKIKCFKFMGNPDYSNIFEEVFMHFDKVADAKDKKLCVKVIEECKNVELTDKPVLGNSYQDDDQQYENIMDKDTIWKNVQISNNKKFGRHLLATRDYKPGEVIFTEKAYVSFDSFASQDPKDLNYFTCDKCSYQSWSTIPCDYCDWAVYCSEACKDEAWSAYHNIECPVILDLKLMFSNNTLTWKAFVASTRILIKALLETGSVAKLKQELESLDQCINDTKGFIQNKQFILNSFRSVYLLHHSLKLEELEILAGSASFILISLAKQKRFINNFDIDKIEDSTISEDVLFLGTLLVRIGAICRSNGLDIYYDKKTNSCSKMVSYTNCGRSVISPLLSLINHSCCPNASWLISDRNKIMLYALDPIQKDDQIFICYHKTFYESAKPDRQLLYKNMYQFTCQCQACFENWPHKVFEDYKKKIENAGEEEIENDPIKEIWKRGKSLLQENRVDPKFVMELSSRIEAEMYRGKQSPVISLLQQQLQNIFPHIWSPKALLFGTYK